MRRQLIFFTAAGGIAFFVDVGVLYLVKASLGIYWGRAVSFLCAVLVTWIFNRHLTFKEHFSGLTLFGEFFRYLAVMMGGGTVNYLLYAALAVSFETVAAQPVWGVAAGSLGGLLFNFMLARSFVFNAGRRVAARNPDVKLTNMKQSHHSADT